jgi:glycosyltransferase involved in cell wall biosynthesis
MRVAFHLGSLEARAENELASRMAIAAERIGLDGRICATTTQIEDFDAELVLSLHTSLPKLSQRPTFGCMWNPPDFFANDLTLVRSAMSYDAHLIASQPIRQYLDDLAFGAGRALAYGAMQPSCHSEPFRPRTDRSRIAYLGTNWDGLRHASLLRSLTGRNLVRFFGPAEAWRLAGADYGGSPAFDGRTLVAAIAECGVALCLHRPEHMLYGVPSMRVFETAAASAVLISDRHPFVEEHFGDAAYYLDHGLSASDAAARVAEIMAEIRAAPAQATERARAAHRVLEEKFTLERHLSDARDLAMASSRRPARKASPKKTPRVDCIVRTGFREPAFLRRALASLEAQSMRDFRVLVVNNGAESRVREVLTEFGGKLSIKEIAVLQPRGRSDSLWRGLRAVEAGYFCVLDDDDRYFPDHLAQLCEALEAAPRAVGAYGGSVKVLEGPGETGRLEEPRELAYFERWDPARLMAGDNFIPSNAFLARTAALSPRALQNPGLGALEDLWLLMELSNWGPFVPTWRVSSEFYWRRGIGDNVSHDRLLFEQSLRRVRTRLQLMDRPAGIPPIDKPFGEVELPASWHGAGMPRRRVVVSSRRPLAWKTAGCVDEVRAADGMLELRGWADWLGVEEAQELVVTGVAGTVTHSEIVQRPDVARALGDWDRLYCGFLLRVAVRQEVDPRAVKVFSRSAAGVRRLLMPR